jgi:hypothetical protein
MRFLDASGSRLNVSDVINNTMLVELRLVRCGLDELGELNMPNLHTLDLSYNHLSAISPKQLRGSPHIRDLMLTGNPLTSVFSQPPSQPEEWFPSLRHLDLSYVPMITFNVSTLRLFPSLRSLNLSHCGLDVLLDPIPSAVALSSLEVLNLTGSPLTYFPPDLLRRLSSLNDLSADNYKLCCSELLPEKFSAAWCQAPMDETASCENLLRSNTYRVFLALFSALGLVGNSVVLVQRVASIRHGTKNGFEILTVMLCMSDMLMGMYLAVIGVADLLYQGEYLWRDVTWRLSVACKTAGFVSMLSKEVRSSTLS